jgi:micrococcal nuclease
VEHRNLVEQLHALKYRVPAVVLLLLTACAAPSGPTPGIPAEALPAVVETVIDGDTVWARPRAGGDLLRVRLIGIDAPETDPERGGPECLGAEATIHAREAMPVGATVFLTADREDADRFGRPLRYVWTADGTFVNEQAVRAGFARAVVFSPNDRFATRLRAAEAEARRAERGIWGRCR